MKYVINICILYNLFVHSYWIIYNKLMNIHYRLHQNLEYLSISCIFPIFHHFIVSYSSHTFVFFAHTWILKFSKDTTIRWNKLYKSFRIVYNQTENYLYSSASSAFRWNVQHKFIKVIINKICINKFNITQTFFHLPNLVWY